MFLGAVSFVSGEEILTEEKLYESRLISGTGLLRIPTDLDAVYYWSVLFDVVRPPTRVFLSNKYSPPRQRYATVTFVKDDYVLSEATIDYPRRRFDMILDGAAQVLLAVKCAYEGLLISFASQNTALGLTIVSYTDLVKPMESLNIVADSLQIRCELDAALQVRLFYRELITCDPENVKQPKPPPPPDPLPPVPPGTPVTDISPPYDEEDDITNPYDYDTEAPPEPTVPDFPYGEECQRYLVKGSITLKDGTVDLREDEFYGVIENFYFNPSSVSQDGRETIIIRSRGLAVYEGNIQPCGNPIDQVFLQVRDYEYAGHELISVEPVE